jgi:ABC-type transport system involved in multi-copper enzyme maturation permease subunit
MFSPIFLVQGTDDDTLACAGMNEFLVFQVDAYMGGPFLLSSVVEENKVAFTELSFLHLPAIFLPLVIGISFEILVVHLIIYR